RVGAAGALARDGLASILAAAQRVVPTSAAGLFVPVTGGRMELVAAIDRFRGAHGRSFPTTSSIIGRALLSGAVQIRAEDEPPDETQIALGGPVALAVPMVRNEVTVGVIGLGVDHRRFVARDVDLLRRFASLVSMALENMRLQSESDAHARDLERLAHFDTLTELPNRALFHDLLRDELARASAAASRLAVLYVDIDHFKDLNNTVGPRLGDAMLRAMGPRLREAVGDAAVIARVSGDEWAAYAPEHDEYAPERLTLMSELRRAIEGDELVLHFQPIVELATRQMRGVEALVRWQHPERGMVPPMEFIPLAERAGLTKPLTVWVLREALRQLRLWRDEGLDLSVAVNLSMRTLHDPELPQLAHDLIESAGVPPALVGFEITETDIMADAEGAMRGLRALRELGVKISIDDFGTGYSSLAYLHRLAVDAVKIDRSFVSRITTDENSASIVRATADLGHALGLEVVAEGVEDERAWGRVRSLSCDFAQGYYIGRPMKGADMAVWIKVWRGVA